MWDSGGDVFPHRFSLRGTCGGAGEAAGGRSGLDNVLLLCLLLNHLVIGRWGLSHEKHTHTLLYKIYNIRCHHDYILSPQTNPHEEQHNLLIKKSSQMN